ncbi:MAG: DUF2892 domain-containing protein [Mariprofundaceae bacterium]|nr:DUF2892 domain-containing protein [Mariprofundaceae bacterium]
MKANVGTIDKVLRLIAGAALISIVFVGPQTPWGWIGIVPIATALAGWCPAYSIFGINSCSTKES